MSLSLNAKNVEEIVFTNKTITNKLIKYKHLFDTWHFANMMPQLKYIKNNIVIELLNLLNYSDIETISEIIGENVVIDESVKKPIKNIQSHCDSLEFDLPYDFNCIDFCCYRKDGNVGVTLWK